MGMIVRMLGAGLLIALALLAVVYVVASYEDAHPNPKRVACEQQGGKWTRITDETTDDFGYNDQSVGFDCVYTYP